LVSSLPEVSEGGPIGAYRVIDSLDAVVLEVGNIDSTFQVEGNPARPEVLTVAKALAAEGRPSGPCHIVDADCAIVILVQM
jgi:hypothetical protein